MVVLRGTDIVCVSSLDWDAHWTSKQQIMHRLAASNRVLYVEEPVTMLAPIKVPARWRRWSAVAPRLRKAQPGLWVLTPPPMLPFGNMYPAVNRTNQQILAGYIHWASRRIGLEDTLLWTYLPTSYALIGRLHPKAVVYHCVDEHSAFPGYITPEVVRAYDDDLTRRADLVMTSAHNLLLSREHLNPNIHHVYHGADIEHFTKALDPDLPIPADIAAIPAPRLGVVGVHDERLDLEAIEALAKADPDWQVILVGPIQPGDVDESRLAALSNVHRLGGKPLAELPGYLKALDVALIPYKLNELTRNIFPLKLYEYLAAGLPVVAGALPELRRFPDRVTLAERPEDYPRLVRESLASDSPDARAARTAIAAQNSWDARVEEISGLVEETLRRKGITS
jgi:glycosyltransferase involved in cell wall biosynthesis